MKWMEVYQPSSRPYKGLPDIDYPFHDKVIVVTNCGASVWATKRSTSAQFLPARPWASRKFTTTSLLVSLMDYDLGYFDLDTRVLGTPGQPFGSSRKEMVGGHGLEPWTSCL
jgi:hypothetical protein